MRGKKAKLLRRYMEDIYRTYGHQLGLTKRQLYKLIKKEYKKK